MVGVAFAGEGNKNLPDAQGVLQIHRSRSYSLDVALQLFQSLPVEEADMTDIAHSDQPLLLELAQDPAVGAGHRHLLPRAGDQQLAQGTREMGATIAGNAEVHHRQRH